LPPLLYLDTARLGQMTPAAKDAQLDFVRLSAEEPSSLYFEQFLRDGFEAWPTFYQERFPGLRTWTGVSGLKRSIRRLVNASDDWQVLLASRSLSLVHLASSCMFRVCRNVLATDLSWPTYERAMETKALRTGNRITAVPLRDDILYRNWTVDDVADYLASAFTEQRCDGLFLPAVDHLGIRLPVRKIVERIRERSELRFCFIDAAQAFCHVPLDDWLELADFIVAGSHKWMGAHLPSGIGLFGRPQTQRMIERRIKHLRLVGRVEDPLLHLTEQLDGSELDGHSETANLAPAFACAAAASGRLAISADESANRTSLIDAKLQIVPRPVGDWQLLRPVKEMRTQIALLESAELASQYTQPDILRNLWLAAGSVVSAFSNGVVRVSFAHHLLRSELSHSVNAATGLPNLG